MSNRLARQTIQMFSAALLVLVTGRLTYAATIDYTNVIGGARVGDTFVVGTIGSVSGTNTWPAAENPSNANDNAVLDKYLNFRKQNAGLIVTPTGVNALFAPTSFVMATGDDAVERDPASFVLYGSAVALSDATPGTVYDLLTMTLVASGSFNLPAARSTFLSVPFANTVTYASYVFLFPTVKDSATASSLQFSELDLEGTTLGTPATPTTPAVPEPGTVMLVGSALAFLARRRFGQRDS